MSLVLNIDWVYFVSNNEFFICDILWSLHYILFEFFFPKFYRRRNFGHHFDFILSDNFDLLNILFDIKGTLDHFDLLDNIWDWSSNVLLDNVLDDSWLIVNDFEWLVLVSDLDLIVGICYVFVNSIWLNDMLHISILWLWGNDWLLNLLELLDEDRRLLLHDLILLVSFNVLSWGGLSMSKASLWITSDVVHWLGVVMMLIYVSHRLVQWLRMNIIWLHVALRLVKHLLWSCIMAVRTRPRVVAQVV